MFRKIEPAINRLIREAESHVGYTAPASMSDVFSSAVGLPGIPWAGPFLDVCIKKAGLLLPSNVSTASALAHYISTDRVFKNPRPGDLVFFQTASDSNHGQPHVGLVTDVEHFTKHGMFQCVEGQTDSGMPKGVTVKNGVYRRNRYAYEVLAFARPNFKRAELDAAKFRKEEPVDPGKLSTNFIQGASIRVGLKHPYVELIQIALAQQVGLRGAPRGEFEHKTRAAFANFQRSIGYIGDQADGTPDVNSLKMLATLTGIFRVL